MAEAKPVNRNEKREHILASAKRVFAERGVVDATMQDIAVAAGVSKGALYLLFSSKDELYLQLATAAAEGLIAHLRRACQLETGFEQARALLKSYATYYLEDKTRFRLALGWLAPGFRLDEATPAAGVYRKVILEIMQISVAAFERGQRDGSIRTDLDAPRTVLQLWGGVVGVLMLRAKADDVGPLPPQANAAIWIALGSKSPASGELDPSSMVEDFVDLVMSSVRARAR